MSQPTALPYGIRDLKLTKYTDGSGTVLGSVSVDLPNMTKLSFSETEEFAELRGDDKLIATRGKGSQVEWSIESGGINYAAWAVMTGGTVTLTGTTPNRVTTFRKRSTDQRPYFRIDGQSISDSGGDVLARLYRCRTSDKVEGEFGDGAFFMTASSGMGLPLLGDYDLLYDFIQRETSAPQTLVPVPNPLAPPSDVAGTSPTATTATITWTVVPTATGYTVQKSADGLTGWTTATGGVVATNIGTAPITALVTATTTFFRVISNGPGGPSDPSAVISLTQP